MFKTYSTNEKKIYVMAHFNHPRELTPEAIEGLNLLMKSGVSLVNQTPLVQGVNDDPEVLADLFSKLSFIGVPPYYVFLCRPTLGNETYSVPVERGYEIFEKSRTLCSGLAKRARLVMSHESGKIEVVGMTEEQIFFKYTRSAEKENNARFMAFYRDPKACWFDDYKEALDEFSLFSETTKIGCL
jgi:L-lysine 2,3-aminomutase